MHRRRPLCRRVPNRALIAGSCSAILDERYAQAAYGVKLTGADLSKVQVAASAVRYRGTYSSDGFEAVLLAELKPYYPPFLPKLFDEYSDSLKLYLIEMEPDGTDAYGQHFWMLGVRLNDFERMLPKMTEAFRRKAVWRMWVETQPRPGGGMKQTKFDTHFDATAQARIATLLVDMVVEIPMADLIDGMGCPHCGQTAGMYLRAIGTKQARSLIYM